MQSLNNQTILVFGGAGFIGSNFIRMAAKRFPKAVIINFDKLTYSGNLKNLEDLRGRRNYVFIKGDIADAKAVNAAFRKYKPDYVINFAAETHVDKSIHADTRAFVKTNIEGVFNVLEEVRHGGNVKQYVQVSTDEVYGSLELGSKKKFTLNMPFAPSMPYAASKAAGDLLCRAYFETWHVPVIVTHCTNNYGPYQYPEKLIPFFTVRMMEGKKLPLYGDGKNVRDWIFVEDHCDALLDCLLSGKSGETYNIGADNERSNREIAGRIIRYFKRDESWLEFVTDRPAHDRRYAIDSGKIRRELGWKPKHGFEKAFSATIEWYLKNKVWIEDIRKKTGGFNSHIKSKNDKK